MDFSIYLFNLMLQSTKNIKDYIGELIDLQNIIAFILFNESHMYAHLWYLGAVLYVLFITTILLKWDFKKGKKLLYYISPVLLVGDLMLGKYSLLLWHREFPYVLTRNWLFVGIPYFSIGIWLSDNAALLQGKITKSLGMALIVVFSISGIIERITLERFGLNASRDHYVSTTFLAITGFLFFLYQVSGKENFMSRIGKNDSTWVYIIHPLVISFLDAVIARIGKQGMTIYLYIRPLMVFIISTFIVECIRRFVAKRKGAVKK